MNRKNYKVKIKLLVLSVLSLLLLNEVFIRDSFATYSCLPYYCTDAMSAAYHIWWRTGGFCYGPGTRWYSCNDGGGDAACEGDSGKIYSSEDDCVADLYWYKSCCVRTSPCTPTTSCSCTSPLSSSNQGNGSKTVSCSNGCGGTISSPCYCPAGSCAALDPIWQDTEPSPPFRSYTLTVPVTTTVIGCPTTDEKTCYTTNQYPNLESIQILPVDETSPVASLPSSVKKIFTKIVNIVNAQTFTEDIMGYTSNFSSGTELNNPVQLVAKYSDPDGTSDIQAVYVWWDDSSIKDFITPTKIADLNAKALKDSFGLMVTVDGDVYVPHIESTTATWKLMGTTSSESIEIVGPRDSMIKLTNMNIDDDGNFITLTTNMEFLNNPGEDVVDTNSYNLWGMANDYAGFTEFEEDGNIKDSNKWEDSGTNWLLDMVDPVINPPATSTSGDNDEPSINLSFTSTDDKEISFVRVDACTDTTNPSLLSAYDGSDYSMQPCDGIQEYLNNTVNISKNAGLISSIAATSGNQDIQIGLNGNNKGSITFYITAMDTSGNYDQYPLIYKLGDWVAVKDGFVFGNLGVTSPTRVLENDWDSGSELKNIDITYDTVDLTNDALLGGTTSETAFLGTLEKYGINHSLKASRYSGVPINAVYAELTMAYELKKRNISYIEKDIGTQLNGTLSSYCDTGEPYDFCIVKNSENISIKSGFECDTRGLIISGGDINIDPDMTNSSITSDSACIILAKNDINIDQGTSKNNASVNYDIIQAFMIAGENINILSDSSNNGLLVEGGLFGFGNEDGTSVLNNRSISWGYRSQYPIIAIDNNAKYGLLSKYLFGSQVEIFKLEIGFKPY